MKKPLLTEMTLREKIGQMLAPHQWDVYGKVEMGYDYSKSDIEKVKALYKKEQFGTLRGEQVGVYYADPDNEQKKIDTVEGYVEGNLFMNLSLKVDSKPYKKFIEKHNTYMKIPPLSGGDCTSGGSNVFNDLTPVINAAAIGAADSEELAYQFGVAIGREMRCGGINWRWSPVVDLGNRNSYSTLRTYANDDPERTVRLAKAYIKGVQSVGVAAAVKHFPSIGRKEARDSHFTATSNRATKEEWWAEQGKVYQEIFDSGVYSVMISHCSFPAVDDKKINGKYVPSTISKKVITDLLKGEMGFGGVVLTDGIRMGALYTLMPYEELVVELVNAGNDVLLGCEINSGDLIETAVLDGRIPETRIDDACQRVLDMKEKLGMFKDDYYDIGYTIEDIREETKRVSEKIAKRSITLVRDRCGVVPFDKKDIKKVSIILSAHNNSFEKSAENLKRSFEKRGIEVYMQRRLKSVLELKEISDNNDLIIYAVDVHMHAPAGYPRLFGEECFTFYHAFNHGKEKSIGVSFGYPYIHYDIMEKADVFINAYNTRPETYDAFVAGILGEIEIVGKSPVSLNPEM